MPTFYGAIDLTKNELRNAVVQNLGSAPGTPSKGQLYMNSSDNSLYFYDGTAWVSTRSAGALTPAASVTTSAVGDAAVVGASTNYARQDHTHGREAFGAATAQTSYGATSTNGAATTLARSDHAHGSVSHELPSGGATNAVLSKTSVTDYAVYWNTIGISSIGAPVTDVAWNGMKITALGDPTTGTDAANKQYVDGVVAGLSWKDPVRLATTANLAAVSGNQAIDGITTATNDRVLVKNQTTASANGIYMAQPGAWSRVNDVATAAQVEGMAVFVMEGTTNGDTAWVCTTNAPITINTSNLTFVQFMGTGTTAAGAGLTMTGNTIDFVAADTSLTVAADTVAVNTGVIATVASVTATVAGFAKKYAAALTGTSSPETVTHNLNTRDIQLDVYNGATPYTAVEVDWDATTVNTAVIRYVPNLGAGYRVVVIG